MDRAVDPTTGTLGIQLLFPNPELLLRPGQYGARASSSTTKQGAPARPQRAVQELQNLYSVAVVDGDNKVAFQNVKVGPRVDSLGHRRTGSRPATRSSSRACSAFRTA